MLVLHREWNQIWIPIMSFGYFGIHVTIYNLVRLLLFSFYWLLIYWLISEQITVELLNLILNGDNNDYVMLCYVMLYIYIYIHFIYLWLFILCTWFLFFVLEFCYFVITWCKQYNLFYILWHALCIIHNRQDLNTTNIMNFS